ncbi:fimbrillin family protein [Phocaeicola sp.]
MKKHVLYCAAAALCFAACSNHETDGLDNGGQPRNAVPIRIGQSVAGITARGVIESGSDVTATVLTANYEGDYNASTAFSDFQPQYTNSIDESNELTAPANISTATFTAGTEQAIVLSPILYYYSSNKTAVAAIAPAGSINGNNVNMTLTDGEQDVMYASADAGEKPTETPASNNSSTPITLEFKHLTTQLKFAFKLSAEPSSTWAGKAVSVKSVTIQNASIPQSVTLGGTANFSTPGSNLDVPGIVTGNSITTDAKSVGRPVMVNASNDIKLDIILTVGGEDYAFHNVQVMRTATDHTGEKLTTVIGSSHLITLTVTEPVEPTGGVAIGTQATVTAWTTGEEGSGKLE